MFVKLPIVEKTWNEKEQKLEVNHTEIIADIDTSFKAHLKWEEQFAKTMGCDLATYTERVKSWVKDPDVAKAQLLGILKLLYCYIDSDKTPTFKDFIALFDVEVADQILNKIRTVLEEVGKTASKN